MAELAEIGFDTFTEEPEGLNAYILENEYIAENLLNVITQYTPLTPLAYEISPVEKENWNAVWESNYEPIEVEGRCRIRASFHEPDPSFEYEILINPKMSFGTGHHETTAMMLAHQLGIAHHRKRVLDVGSGTGILAIMAARMGASRVSAFDIEDWATLNAIENTQLNGVEAVVSVRQGTIDDEPLAQFEIVLANINRNILLKEIPKYTQYLAPKGILLVSGFYESDIEDIAEMAQSVGLQHTHTKTQNQWASLRFDTHESR